MTTDHQEHKPKSKLRHLKIVWWIVIFAVIGAVGLAIPVAAATYRMAAEAQAGRAALTDAAAAASRSDIKTASADLVFAQQHLAAADRFGKVLAPFEILPYAGTDIKSVRSIVSSSLQTATALARLGVLGQSVLDILSRAQGFDPSAPTVSSGVIAFFKLAPDDRAAALAALSKAPDELNASLSEIDKALIGFNSLPDNSDLGSVVASLRPAVVELETVRGKIAVAAELAKLLPALSGYPAPKNYLLLLQNNTELRPTGGFIGTLATVTVASTMAQDLKVSDVYALDGVGAANLKTVPPAPLAKYLSAPKWYLRDANWSPDFPTAAREVVDIYNQEGGAEKFDGVLAVDPTLAVDLLKIVGNVTIGASTFTPDNVTDEIEYQVEKGFDVKGLPVAQRKDILIALATEVFTRVAALPNDKWQLAVNAFVRALDEKHMLIASFDPDVAGFAASRNWDDAVHAPANDFLMVVDANLAALKTDSVMSRAVSYSFKPDANGLTATVNLTYANHGGFSWKTTRYRTYTRIYVPPGSTLVSSSGAMANDKILDPRHTPGTVDTVDELGLRSFGAFLSVEPGETRALSFTYRLPASIVSAAGAGNYSLNVQKQPGTIAVPLTLNLDFGKKVASATPPESRANWGDGVYTQATDLTIDREFKVGF
jgi:hypothetical protein